MKQTKSLPLSSAEVKNFAFYIMLFVIICLCVYIYLKVSDGSVKCMAAPIPYGISNLKSGNGLPITCECSYPGSMDYFLFTKDNGTIIRFNDLNGGVKPWEQ